MIILYIIIFLGEIVLIKGDIMNEIVWTKRNKILFLILGIIAIILVLYQLFYNSKNDNDVEIVTSTSNFYTVSNCVDRYLSYLSVEDVDNLILLIDKSYKKKNNLKKNNFFSKIDRLDGVYRFEAKKMYQQVINDNVTKYFVKGYLISEELNGGLNIDKKDYYIIVLLDKSNSTYSIIPYDGEIFNKEEMNEK